MPPHWLLALAIAFLSLAFVCALAICVDPISHPQHMAVMNFVWPITAL